ncbi:MAG: cytochrome c oxidase subunit II [Actinomycetes bacterium]
MSELETAKRLAWWKRADAKKAVVLWAIFTLVIGYVASTIQTRVMGSAASENMSSTINMIKIFTWAASPVAGLVAALTITTLLGKRHFGDNPPPEAEHEIRNSPKVAATWVVVSTLLCLFAVIYGMVLVQKDENNLRSANSLNIDVTGQQWAWSFNYVDNGGARSADLYLPVDKHVVFHVTSTDVMHSFWIVQMGIKVDANPGYITETATTPNKIGVYDLRCAELCGLYHAYMQKQVHVVSQADYDAWVQSQGGKA